jgi:hypothetical protein
MYGDIKRSESKIKWSLTVTILIFALSSCSKQPETNSVITYEFITDQSSVTQTGGFAGVHQTHPIKGNFQLSVNYDANTASFERVDANLAEPKGFLPAQSLGELFNMTSLRGTVSNGTTIVFTGKTTEPESDVSITLTLSGNTVALKGATAPPPGSADFFIFNLDAVAKKK